MKITHLGKNFHLSLLRLAFVMPVLLSISCATVDVKRMGPSLKFEPDADEKGLWSECEELQKSMLRSNFVYADTGLSNYVNTVLQKTLGGTAKAAGVELKAYVINDPNFNAAAWPNGVIYVHTGLLANIDNEAQLATILGHEAIHFLHRHELKSHRTRINTTTFLSTLQVASVGASFGVAASGYDPRGVDLIRQYLEIGVVGAFFGYNRDLEREADEGGFELIEAAGYDIRESKKAFENLEAATKDEKFDIPYFYQTHPRIRERIRNFDSMIKKRDKAAVEKAIAVVNHDLYIEKIKQVMFETILVDLKRNKVKLARREIDRFKRNYPDDYRGQFLEGELLSLEGKTSAAIEQLLSVCQRCPTDYDAQRKLGLLYYKQGDRVKAKQFFENYLALKPTADDIEYIRGYLNEK